MQSKAVQLYIYIHKYNFFYYSSLQKNDLTTLIQALINSCLDYGDSFSTSLILGFALILSILHVVARENFLNECAIPLLNIFTGFPQLSELRWHSSAQHTRSFLIWHLLTSTAHCLLFLRAQPVLQHTNSVCQPWRTISGSSSPNLPNS